MIYLASLISAVIVLALSLAIILPWSKRRLDRSILRARNDEAAQQQLGQRESRKEEQALMTRGLAHEIRNPLSTIGLHAQLLQEDIDRLQRLVGKESNLGLELDSLLKRSGRLQNEAQRLKIILEDFMRFAGRMELHCVPTDLSALLEELSAFFEPQASSHQVNLRLQADTPCIEVSIDHGMFRQVMLNLMLNAIQAMQQAREENQPHGGACDLMVHLQHTDNTAIIRVVDTGPGIPEKQLKQIFQPYFTSKKGGSGLGLPTARRIIEAHGGDIEVTSDAGKGTQFTLTLPLSRSDNHIKSSNNGPKRATSFM